MCTSEVNKGKQVCIEKKVNGVQVKYIDIKTCVSVW